MNTTQDALSDIIFYSFALIDNQPARAMIQYTHTHNNVIVHSAIIYYNYIMCDREVPDPQWAIHAQYPLP